MADVKFLLRLREGLKDSLAQVQRELDAAQGEKEVKSRRHRSRKVIVPTEVDTAAAKQAELELRRNGIIPIRKTA